MRRKLMDSVGIGTLGRGDDVNSTDGHAERQYRDWDRNLNGGRKARLICVVSEQFSTYQEHMF